MKHLGIGLVGMKWLGIGAGVVLVALIGTVALLPRLVDWNGYRPQIAALASDAIGRPVVIDGNIRAELFPIPQVTAGRIRVPDQAGGADLATIRWAEAQFKFSDLLRGDVTLTGLALVEPDLTIAASDIERFTAAEPPRPESTGETGPVLGGFERQEVKRIEIRNGRVSLSGASDGVLMAERVSGSVETPAVGRRIAVSLAGSVGGRDLALDMRFAPPQRDAGAPVAFTVTDMASGSRLRIGGDWSLSASGPILTGAFSLSDGEVGAIAALAGTSLPSELSALGGPVRLDGDLVADTASFTISNLSVNTDALSATGSLSADWRRRPKLDLALRVGRLDLAALGAPQTGAGPKTGTAAFGEGNTPGPDASRTAGDDEADLMTWIGTLPADLTLDLSVAGARLRGTVVRRISVRASVDQGTVTLEELSAQLPGGTDLSIAGFGDMTGPEPLLEGNATLRADDLRRLMNWAGLPVPNVSADRLRRFSMVSGISLQPRRLDIIDAAVELDGVTATAAAAVALRRRLGIGLRLYLDHINLDGYRAVVLPAIAPDDPGAGADDGNAGAQGAGDAAGGAVADLWTKFDASLDLRIGRVVALGIPFNEVAGNLVLKDGVLTANELTFQDAGGVSGTFGGQMAAQGTSDAAVLAFEGQSDDLGRVSALLQGPDFLAGMLRSLGPAQIKASYQPSADGPSLLLQVNGDQGELSLGARPGVDSDANPSLEILSGGMKTGSIDISGLSGRFTVQPGLYQLEKLSGTLNGGDLYLSGSLQQRDDGLQQLLITGALDEFAVERELADLDGPLGLSGTVSVRGQGEATGSDWRAMSALNDGWFDIDGNLAVVVGPSRSSIVKVRQVSDVRAALRDHFSKPGPLRGVLNLKNGVLSTSDLRLSGADGAVLSLLGRLGLDDLDLSAELVLREAAGAPQTARLVAEGPAEAPNLRLEGAGLSEN